MRSKCDSDKHEVFGAILSQVKGMRQNDFNSPTEKFVGLFVAFFGDVILEQRVTDKTATKY